MSASPVDDPSAADGKLPNTDTPPEAINLNVGGRELAGPGRGFGQLWRKRYRVRLVGAEVTPEEVIRRWRARFADYYAAESAGARRSGEGEREDVGPRRARRRR